MKRLEIAHFLQFLSICIRYFRADTHENFFKNISSISTLPASIKNCKTSILFWLTLTLFLLALGPFGLGLRPLQLAFNPL